MGAIKEYYHDRICEGMRNNNVWVPVMNDDGGYFPESYDITEIYKGPDALPYFDTKGECINWIVENIRYPKMVPVKESYTTDEVRELLQNLSAECLCDDGNVKGPADAYKWIESKLVKTVKFH